MDKSNREKNQEALDKLVAYLRAGTEPEQSEPVTGNGHGRAAAAVLEAPTDEEVLEKCRAARNAAKFADLYDAGDVHAHHHGDDSAADLALLGMLAFWTQDEAQLENLFSTSALGQREKWRRRADYRKRTIKRALSDLGEVYDWSESRHRKVSSSPAPYIGGSDNDTSDDPEIVWFADLGEPKEREYLIEQVGVKGYPIIVFGAGGVAKSFGVLSAGVAIASASGVEKWLGLQVAEHGHVLYLDFELDVDEQHRRVRDLCAGLGVLIPKRLAYLSGVGIPVEAAFRKAGEFVREYGAKAVIIDSMGLALEGDIERGRDVLAFYRRYIDPLRRAGTTPFIVDHEGKLQTGEKHKHKSPIGSAYKAWAARNVLQFELEEYDKANSALNIRVRQTKTNFTPVDPFGVRFAFAEKKVTIETFELPDTELVEEERIPMKERIIGALRAGPATNVELQKLTGAGDGTVRNKLSELMQEKVVVADDGRPKVYQLVDEEVSLSSPPYIETTDNDTSEKLLPQAVRDEFNRLAAGARKNLPVYLKGQTTLEILVRSVLVGLGKDPDDWQRHAAVVEEGARDPQNHPLECDCPECA